MFKTIKNFIKRIREWIKDKNTPKRATECEHFAYIVFDDENNCIGGTNNYELAKALCDMVAERDTDKFYICGDDCVLHIYSQDAEQNAERYAICREIVNPTRAPYIPLENDRPGCWWENEYQRGE